MKPAVALAFILGIFACASSATAGPRVRVFVNAGAGGFGGCRPVTFLQPACYARRAPVCYTPAPVFYYPRPARVYDSRAPIYCAPSTPYRAPVVSSGITVSRTTFGWR